MIELIKKGEGLNSKKELSKIKAGWDCGSAGCNCGTITNWEHLSEIWIDWFHTDPFPP